MRTWLAAGACVSAGLALAYGLWLGWERSRSAVLAPPGPARSASASPTAPWPATETPAPEPAAPVRVTGVEWVSRTLTVTLQVGPVPGDLLFETPQLAVAGEVIEPAAESLQAARQALLKAGGGAARFSLAFALAARGAGEGQIVLNPASAGANAARPRVVVPVTWPAQEE